MKEKIDQFKEKILKSHENFLEKIKKIFPKKEKKDNSDILKTEDFSNENKNNFNSKIKDIHQKGKEKILDFHNNTKEKILNLHKNTKENFSGFLNIFSKKIEKEEKIDLETKNKNILDEDVFSEDLKKNDEDNEAGLQNKKNIINNSDTEIDISLDIKLEKQKNAFTDIFGKEGEDDIFSGVLKKKNSISISDNLEDALSQKDENLKEKNFFNTESFKDILKVLNSHILVLILFLISVFIGIIIFFIISLDQKNFIFSYVGGETIGSKISNLEFQFENKKNEILKIESSIKKMAGDVPNKLYLRTPYFESLNNDLKAEIFNYYDNKTGEIKKISKEEKDKLIILFNENSELSGLKNTFVKQDVLNSIIDNRVYWKSVYKDLIDVTNSVFKYNEVINYVVYNNFSVNSEGKISVSGVVSDPSGKVFSQLFRLEKAINDSEHFSGVSIDNFNKTLNPDDNVGGMMTSINLTFNYIK